MYLVLMKALYLSYMQQNLQIGVRSVRMCLNLMAYTQIESPHDKTNKMTAPSKDSDQPGHPQSDQSSLCVQWVANDPSILHADSEDSDQTGRMPRLI